LCRLLRCGKWCYSNEKEEKVDDGASAIFVVTKIRFRFWWPRHLFCLRRFEKNWFVFLTGEKWKIRLDKTGIPLFEKGEKGNQ
jgi:hypothetical protein